MEDVRSPLQISQQAGGHLGQLATNLVRNHNDPASQNRVNRKMDLEPRDKSLIMNTFYLKE